jgi:hypothetical protein
MRTVGRGITKNTTTACDTVEGWMSKMKSDGRVEVPVSVLEAARRDFFAERISDELVSYLLFDFRNGLTQTLRLCKLSKHTLMK